MWVSPQFSYKPTVLEIIIKLNIGEKVSNYCDINYCDIKKKIHSTIKMNIAFIIIVNGK